MKILSGYSFKNKNKNVIFINTSKELKNIKNIKNLDFFYLFLFFNQMMYFCFSWHFIKKE
jgi:hypothetical protein